MLLLLRLFYYFLAYPACKILILCKGQLKRGRRQGREEEVYHVKIHLRFFLATCSLKVQMNEH